VGRTAPRTKARAKKARGHARVRRLRTNARIRQNGAKPETVKAASKTRHKATQALPTKMFNGVLHERTEGVQKHPSQALSSSMRIKAK
jgi:hypothetical protein